VDSSLSTQKKWAHANIEEQRRTEAELLAERNGPPIAQGDYHRLEAALAFKREREQLEQARYARFQWEQKLALAQASSPRMLMSGGEIPSDYRQVEYGSSGTRRQIAFNRKPGLTGAAYSRVQGASGQEWNHPARFYVRQLQEDSATQADAAANANEVGQQAQQADGDAPYAIPVPGRPGYVTMPPKMGGYIDVRGYAPGALVMDPWTKTVIRVP